MKNKHSSAEVGQLFKLAAENLRNLSAENQDLKEKVAHFEKTERAEKIASLMEEKGLQPELSLQEKVAGLLKRDDLSVVEEAVGMTAPQMKLAGVHDPLRVAGGDEVGYETDAAADQFLQNLLSID